MREQATTETFLNSDKPASVQVLGFHSYSVQPCRIMAKIIPGAMDAEFLKRTVGDPLSEALTSLVMEQPADPIEFIGEALLDYVKRREEEAKVGGEMERYCVQKVWKTPLAGVAA